MFGVEALLKKHNSNFDFGKTNNQEVRDLLEIAIFNASKANLESKIERLRLILFGHITNPQPFDYISRYLDLALKLNDSQIRILKYYVDSESKLEPLRKEIAKFIKVKVRAEEVDIQIHIDKDGNFTGVTSGNKDYTVEEWNNQVKAQFNKTKKKKNSENKSNSDGPSFFDRIPWHGH
ncbi:MAG: hypothetical protein AAFS12_05165 [Cyanobacteria bacterium J06632_19]